MFWRWWLAVCGDLKSPLILWEQFQSKAGVWLQGISGEESLAEDRLFYQGHFEVKEKYWQKDKNSYKNHQGLLKSSSGCENLRLFLNIKREIITQVIIAEED